MKHSFTCDRDTEGYPLNLDANIKEMAKLVDSGEWNEDNNEQFINYFKDNFVRDEEKLKWLRETNGERTEIFDKDLKNREFRSAIHELLIIKDLTEEHVLKKIDEYKEFNDTVYNNRDISENIGKFEEFVKIVNIEDINIRKERINNYIGKYL